MFCQTILQAGVIAPKAKRPASPEPGADLGRLVAGYGLLTLINVPSSVSSVDTSYPSALRLATMSST
jgi:hypothetical protein